MILVPSSFGDVVAAISIVHSIYKALSDSTGSSFEFQCLIEELHSFEDALRLVDRALQDTPLREYERQVIKVEIKRCLKLLTKFWSRIQPYEGIVSGKWSAIWDKIAWAIWKADEVASFRRKLFQHKGNINVFLNAVAIITTTSSADETRKGLTLVMAKLDEVQRGPYPFIGHDLGNALILIDALGERKTLPMELCFSPEKFHQTLMHLFEGKIGERHVDRHDYTISTMNGESMVDLNNWAAVVRQGTVIVMSIIVKRKLALAGVLARRQRNACPRCDETDVGVMPDEGWLQCRRCARRFLCGDITSPQPLPREENIADFRNIHVMLVKRAISGSLAINAEWSLAAAVEPRLALGRGEAWEERWASA